jgi:hypothetical protein
VRIVVGGIQMPAFDEGVVVAIAAEINDDPIATYSAIVLGLDNNMPCSDPVQTWVAATLVLLEAATSLVKPDGWNASNGMAGS